MPSARPARVGAWCRPRPTLHPDTCWISGFGSRLRISGSIAASQSSLGTSHAHDAPNRRSGLHAGFGLASSATTHAATRALTTNQNPGAVCQLSIPTTDTQIRPKATGFRNESTTKNAFVFCGNVMPTNDSFATSIEIDFASMDGVARTISCTGVNGFPGIFAPSYSTKTVSSTANGTTAYLLWTPADFSGVDEIPSGYAPSITCTLPPQTAITMVTNRSLLEIGN